MKTQIIVALIAGLAAILGPFLQNHFRIDPRQSIERDLKIAEQLPDESKAKQLPDESKAKQLLKKDIERRVQELAMHGKGKRAWGLTIFCLVAGGGCLYGMAVLFYKGWVGLSWAHLLIVPSLILFVLALAFLNQVPGYFKKVPRDKQGNVVSIEELGGTERDKK